jgi:hypothetical protein
MKIVLKRSTRIFASTFSCEFSGISLAKTRAMIIMKHIILLILIFITISACSRNSDGGSPPPAPPEGPTETQPQPEQEVAQEESEDEQSEEFVEDGIVEEQIVEDENPIQEKTDFAAPETYGGQLLVSYLENRRLFLKPFKPLLPMANSLSKL